MEGVKEGSRWTRSSFGQDSLSTYSVPGTVPNAAYELTHGIITKPREVSRSSPGP